MIDSTVLEHFKKVDRILYTAALTQNRPLRLQPRTSYFEDLCDSIIGQQLSTRVGDVISARFRTLFPDDTIEPETVSKLPIETVRSIGISNAKAKYIIDLGTKVVQGQVTLDNFENMSNEEIMTELTKVKGIGPWTVEMFLMFTLGRPDIFSTGDLGLKRAIQKLYGIENEPTARDLQKISSKWKPYRTYASMILWRTLEKT